ncbi:hypothetical protein BBP40_011057 [Aspergillus hancockii]|nr:hypothetical protein BBP40_011057 [Aspergillus hancockii]
MVFRYLDGRYEDDPKTPSQTQVAAASTIVANVVGFCIRISLAAALTQCFWHLVRITPMRLEILEYLYTMRGSPMSFFSGTVFQKGWLLVVITIILWRIPIAMSFPSSAMMVRSAISTEGGSQVEVSGMGVSDTWNGNTTAIIEKEMSLFVVNNWREADDPDWVEVLRGGPVDLERYAAQTKPLLLRLATEAIVSGAPRMMTSPCGLNCSYELSFDGPYISCSSTSIEKATKPFNYSLLWFEVFKAGWTSIPKDNYHLVQDFRILNAQADSFVRNNSTDTVTFHYTSHELTCRPRRAEYHVVQEFSNGGQHSTVTIGDVYDLTPMDDFYFSTNSMTDAVVNGIRDRNIMAITMAVSRPLTGSYYARVTESEVELEPVSQNAAFLRVGNDGWSADLQLGAKTLFTVNEEIINSMLANITLSAISQFQLWPTTVNVTRHELRTQFVFSRPLNLLLPYFISLEVALPLVAVGYWSLRQNSVPATDSGFLQVATTTRGNREFGQLAMGGRLGRNHNESARLKNLEVQFGELTRPNESGFSKDHAPLTTDLRMAGFAPKNEVTPLVVGKRYGKLHEN